MWQSWRSDTHAHAHAHAHTYTTHTCTHAHTHARTHTQHTHTHTHTLIHCLFLTGDISDKGRLFHVSTSHFAVDLLPHLTSHDAVICLCSSDENASQLQEIMEKLVTSVHQDVSQLSLHHSCFENEQLSWLSEWSGYGVACVCLLCSCSSFLDNLQSVVNSREVWYSCSLRTKQQWSYWTQAPPQPPEQTVGADIALSSLVPRPFGGKMARKWGSALSEFMA